MNTQKQINKDKVARSFLKGRATYDDNARIQRQVSGRLVEKLTGYEDISYDRVLEIGCCTGMLTEMVLQTFPVSTLYLNDLVEEFLDDVRHRLSVAQFQRVLSCFGDIEKLTLPPELDLVISSATFQWLADIEKLFMKTADSLKDSGHLAFSIFGPGTLKEFKEVTGIGLEYSAVGTILDALDKYFYIEEEETIKDTLFFSSPKEVLRHLQATGVGGVQQHRWTRRSLGEYEKRYYEMFGSTSGIPVTYMSSYVIASKKV